MKKVIAFDVLSESPGYSGQVRIYRGLFRALMDAGADYKILIFASKPQKAYYEQRGISDDSFRWITTFIDNTHSRFGRIATQEILVPIYCLIFNVRFLFCNGPAPLLTLFLNTLVVQRFTNILVFNLPEIYPFLARIYHRTRWRYALRIARHILANTNFTKKSIARGCRDCDRKIHVIPEGIDEDIVRMEDRELRDRVRNAVFACVEAPKKTVYLPVGFTPHKNVGVVLEAIRHGHLSEDVQFVFSGNSSAPFLSSILESYSDLFQSGKIRYLGFCSAYEVHFLIRRCLFVIYPSKYESYGVPPLEAIAYGKPVVASDIPPIREVCGRLAMYFNPNDSQDLLNQIEILLGKKDETHSNGLSVEKPYLIYPWGRIAEMTLGIL